MLGVLLTFALIAAPVWAAKPARESQAEALADTGDSIGPAEANGLPVSIRLLHEETAQAASELKQKMADSATDDERAAWGRELNALYQRFSLRMFDLREADALTRADVTALDQIARERRAYLEQLTITVPAAHSPAEVAAKAAVEAEGGVQ